MLGKRITVFIAGIGIAALVSCTDQEPPTVPEPAFDVQEPASSAYDEAYTPADLDVMLEITQTCTGGESVLLIQDYAPWGYDANVVELTAQGKNFCIINSSQIGTTNLAAYPEILISADQDQSFYNNLFPGGVVHAALTSYVAGGGVLSANLTDGGWNGGYWSSRVFVGGLQHTLTYTQTNDIAAPSHPIIADGLPCPSGNCAPIVDGPEPRDDLDDWNYDSHGYFTNLPAGHTVILRDGSERPVMIEYPFGSGTVIATLTTTEWRYYRFGGNKKLLANEIAYQDFISVNIDKEKLFGPEEVGIYTADPTPFSFQITYRNSAQDFPVRIIDTAPAEFEVMEVAASDGVADFDWTGKPGKSATRIEWDLIAGTDCSGGCTLTVDVQTKRSASGGGVYKPTSCGPLPLNDGATAYEVDPLTGDIKIVAGEPVIVVGPSNALVVDAVGDQGAGATKPCAPGDLAVELSGFNTLVLDWADNAEAVDHYNVYRGPTEDGPFTVIGEASLSEYPDTELDPGDYCYQVKAAFGPGDQDEGNESETVCENVPELPPCPCWTAEQLEATSWSHFTGWYDPSGLFRRFDLIKVPPYPARPWLAVYDFYGDNGKCEAWWADGTSTSAGPLPRSTVQACYETLSNIAKIQSVPCIDCGW